MLIRRIERSDGPILRSLRLSALADAPYAFGAKLEDVLRESVEKFDADAERHADSNVSTSFLAFEAERPVGLVGAYFEQASKQAFACSLWLRSESRGGATAGDLLGAAINWLAGHDAKECYAWVADANFRAIRFYKKFGFENTSLSI